MMGRFFKLTANIYGVSSLLYLLLSSSYNYQLSALIIIFKNFNADTGSRANLPSSASMASINSDGLGSSNSNNDLQEMGMVESPSQSSIATGWKVRSTPPFHNLI